MPSTYDICSLDYLIGTLSTAYKGVITSLVVKDFCMTGNGDFVTLKGTVLSMPPGNYEASLMQKGVELARTVLDAGHFELKGPAARLQATKDLQIDIVQTGRHIGTFLLQKEEQGGVFMSAVELSKELKGMDFKLLTVPLRNQVGLLRKAEDIITRILSTKKDWVSFSESLNSFSRDFFWSARSSFYEAFGILAHFSCKAAHSADPVVTTRPVANFLALIDLPLEEEAEDNRVRSAVDTWLRELEASPLDFSTHLGKAAAVLKTIQERFPGMDIGPRLAELADGVRKKISALPTLTSAALDPLAASNPEVHAALILYGSEERKVRVQKLTDAISALKQGNASSVFLALAETPPDLIDDAKMLKSLFGTVSTGITPRSAEAIVKLIEEILGRVPELSPAAKSSIKTDLPIVIEKLTSFGRFDLCLILLGAVVRLAPPLKDEIVMHPLIASAVLRSGSDDLIERYAGVMTAIVIPGPRVKGLSAETWAEVVNPLHLERLTRFMEVLQLGDGRFGPILAHIIANLFITGVFIPDDRLFQRAVSAYLNSAAMEHEFTLNFLLLETLPVYFNEVGAVSRIRDLSTEIDAWGNDPVLYFVRKQVHVNASNYNIRLLETMIRAWTFNDPDLLRAAVPPDVFAGIKPELFQRYTRFIRPFLASVGVLIGNDLNFEKLRQVPEKEFSAMSRDGQLDEIPTKVMLLCRLYQEIVKKYSRESSGTETREGTLSIAGYLEGMKRQIDIVRAPEETKASESLYFKRHIAFGIPSVLGTYHEPKFDALGEFLRLGANVRPLLEETAADIQTGQSSPERIGEWLNVLIDSWELLKLHGFRNFQIEEIIQIIKANRLHLSQVADLLKIWQKELAWMVESLGSTFHEAIVAILRRLPAEDLPEHLVLLDRTKPDHAERAADSVIRDILAGVPGLMEADRIAERLLTKVRQASETRDETINRDLRPGAPWFDLFDLPDREAMSLAPLLGGKAKNLIYLHSRGFSIPAGVVFRPGVSHDLDEQRLRELIREAVARLEARTGRRYGGGAKPLFLSVRSGSYISMPGILSTILYCGMNRATMDAFARETGDLRSALDSYRRFIEHYATTVLSLEHGVFEEIRSGFVAESIADPGQVNADDMKELVKRYETALESRGLRIPEDVNEQLFQSVRAVAASWRSKRAEQFRRATRTSEHWGTPVLLMQMIPGNFPGSGTSVFFTRNPFTYEPGVFGETRSIATGDELVYGRRLNRPLSAVQAAQRRMAGEETGGSLEEAEPDLFSLHQGLGAAIEAAMGGLPQEVEATYTGNPDGTRTLFVLQTRRMEFSTGAVGRFDEICAMESRVIGRGIGAHGGALSGVASFAKAADQMERLKRESGMPVILFRATANTDDVSLMPVIGGIVASAGGVTSHAAVLAQKFGISAVVACSDLVIERNERGEAFARINGHLVKEGSLVSIDGSTGLVFSGSCFSISNVLR